SKSFKRMLNGKQQLLSIGKTPATSSRRCWRTRSRGAPKSSIPKRYDFEAERQLPPRFFRFAKENPAASARDLSSVFAESITSFTRIQATEHAASVMVGADH